MKRRKGTSGQFQCSQCSKQFKYDSDRKRHELSHSPHFKCEVCTKTFSFISALRRHQKQHQRKGSVECSDCGKKFRDETLLRRHVQYAHKGTFLCSNCKTTFSSELALNTHMKTHNPESERKYVCSKIGCGKSFNFPHHLKHHELAHTDEKQFYCDLCHKGFIQSHHLKTHMKTHNPDKRLCCPVKGCTKKFATEYSRKRHLQTHNKQKSRNKSDVNKSLSVDLKTETQLFEVFYEEDSSVIYPQETESKESPSYETEFKVTSCKTALGQCIMDGESNCLCAQISHSNINFAPMERFNINNTQNETIELQQNIIQSSKPDVLKNTMSIKACEGCECSNYEKVVELRKICPNADKAPAVLPDFEYTNDGIVKLKDTIDIDISEKCKDDPKSVMPYYSCKAVLGNCIVSGNGTMGEGCLCAKMFAGEQVMEQEIDDITPRPQF